MWEWILLVGGAVLALGKVKLLGKGVDKIAGIGMVLTALFVMGVFSGLTLPSQSGVTGDISDVKVSAGQVNHSTNLDFYPSDQEVDMYVTDALILDDELVNFTLTVTRGNVEKAESFVLSCASPDFTKSGTTYNIVSKDTDSKLEGYIDGSGTRTTGGWSKSVAFAEGDVDNDYIISFKQDEAAEDILSTKESVEVTCNIGGKSVIAEIIAND